MFKYIFIMLVCCLTNLVGAQSPINSTPQPVSGFIKVSTQFNPLMVQKLGGQIGCKAGNILTFTIPKSNLSQLVKTHGVLAIQLDMPVWGNMDGARLKSKVDSVHLGINLPQAYSGKGVVVGIIDAGFDYAHPTFYDTTGTQWRIKRVWEQHKTGIPPIGFTYGNELKTESEFTQAQTDVGAFSHGTHVGGIAAGSGFGSGTTKYRGVAYESDLVFVGIKPFKNEWKSMSMTSVVDAVKYIFDYAASVQKPAVVNLSWGCSIGPNDGSSLFSQAIDNLTGAGRVFVISAGNNGNENIHLTKHFTTADTMLQSFISFPLVNAEKRTWIDTWGELGQVFRVKYTLYNGINAGQSTGWLSLNIGTLDTFLVGLTGDTCYLQLTLTAADYNGKPHVLVDAFSKTNDLLLMSISSKNGRTHSWLGYVNDYNGYYGAFISSGRTYAVNGDNNYTLGELASTKSAITVAAYVSKNSFKNLSGSTFTYTGYVTNGIASFSSRGPTVDGRKKPDITAPGMTIASGVNSFDLSYANGGDAYNQSVYTFERGGKNYTYAESSGTSMSAPMITGIAALMLQANPALSAHQLKQLLQATATKDSYTGIVNVDSNRWGAGKVNAYQAVNMALQTVGIANPIHTPQVTMFVYPNPIEETCFVNVKGLTHQNVTIELVNTLGQVELQQKIYIDSYDYTIPIQLNQLKRGVYRLILRDYTRPITVRNIVKI